MYGGGQRGANNACGVAQLGWYHLRVEVQQRQKLVVFLAHSTAYDDEIRPYVRL